MSDVQKGICLALTAAALNASIGIFSKVLLQKGLTIQDIAFLKTVTAFLLLSLFLIRRPLDARKAAVIAQEKADVSWLKLLFRIALCAFLGIFVLFFFETNAYRYGAAADVVVVLMASAAVSALVFGRFLLKESITVSALIGTGLAVAGIFVISWTGGADYRAAGNAALAGSGYGLFSVLVQKFGLKGGLVLTRMLMLFGGLYLLIPFVGQIHPIVWDWKIVANILALAVLPTILGFYCTTKALVYLSAANVQVAELSEPLFAAFLAWIFVNEMPGVQFFAGAVLIVSGIVLMNRIYAGLAKLGSG